MNAQDNRTEEFETEEFETLQSRLDAANQNDNWLNEVTAHARLVEGAAALDAESIFLARVRAAGFA